MRGTVVYETVYRYIDDSIPQKAYESFFTYGIRKADRYRVTEKRGAIWMKLNWKKGVGYLMLFSLCFLSGRTAAAMQAGKAVTASG